MLKECQQTVLPLDIGGHLRFFAQMFAQCRQNDLDEASRRIRATSRCRAVHFGFRATKTSTEIIIFSITANTINNRN